MRRVVITGIGIVSSIGNDKEEVRRSLREGRTGVARSEEFEELGFRSHVFAPVRIDPSKRIDRKIYRFMADAAAFGYLAMQEAVEDADLPAELVSSVRSGMVLGTGGASPSSIVKAADILREKGVRRVGPYMVTKSMASTIPACVGTAFRIKGISYSISSACSTSAHCIGHGAELIQLGKQDIVFAGGGEEVHWTLAVLFDAMGALSAGYNDRPGAASRPFDVDRDGFVISGGGGVVVLEELEHARRRGARILAELVGYGATSDGSDMVQPSGEGAVRCMRQALQGVEGEVQYLNTHGTSTPVGDVRELEAIREVFGDRIPPFNSTKSLTGHAQGAAGVNEVIYSLLMMESGFISASANVDNPDPAAVGMPLVTELRENLDLHTVMSNSFGFGGTNCSLVFRRWDE